MLLPYAAFHVRHKDNSHFILNTYLNIMHLILDLPCTVLDSCDGHKIGHSIAMIDCFEISTEKHTSLYSLRQKSLNSSFPVILLLVYFILFHLISFKLFLLQLFLHSLTSVTHPFTLEPIWLQMWTFHQNCLALSC